MCGGNKSASDILLTNNEAQSRMSAKENGRRKAIKHSVYTLQVDIILETGTEEEK